MFGEWVVVGGLLGNPIGHKRLLTASDDLDNVSDGIYWTQNTDNPHGYYGPNCIYIQITHKIRGDVYQIAFCANFKVIACRFKMAGSEWRDWVNAVSL